MIDKCPTCINRETCKREERDDLWCEAYQPERDKPIKHKSLRPERAAVNASERIFAEEWEKQNKADGHVNHGRGALECILLPYVKSPLNPLSYEHVGEISQRDADVAATVIQWLGTHVGQCFLRETMRKIEAAEKRA